MTATAAQISNTVTVQVVPGSATTTVSMGSGTGAQFMAGMIGASVAPSLSAGGSTSLNVTLQQSDGTLYTTSTPITFSSPCEANGPCHHQLADYDHHRHREHDLRRERLQRIGSDHRHGLGQRQ